MIVGKDDSARIAEDRLLEDYLGIDHNGISRTARDFLYVKQAVAFVDEKGDELLWRFSTIVPAEMACDVFNGFEIDPGWLRGVLNLSGESQRSFDGDSLGRANATDPGKFLYGKPFDGLDAVWLRVDQIISYLNRRPAPLPDPEQNGQ